MIKQLILLALSLYALQVSAEVISEKDYGEKWPFTVGKGELACRNNAVTLAVDGTTYAINGAASAQGYKDITPIWREEPHSLEYAKKVAREEKKTLSEVQEQMGIMRVNISPVLNAGLALCE